MRITVACGLDSRSRAGFWKNDGATVRAVRTIQYNNLLFYLLLIHHHHHVQEGLGLIPVPCILKIKLVPPSLPQSSYVSSSFWFILQCLLSILFVSILCVCCSHFSWYCFISFTIFSAPVFSLIHWFFSLSSFVIPRRCLKNFICAASKRCSSLFFSTQASLPNFNAALAVIIIIIYYSSDSLSSLITDSLSVLRRDCARLLRKTRFTVLV